MNWAYAVRKLQPTEGRELRSPLIQRDCGFTARIPILDPDQTICEIRMGSAVVSNRGPHRRLVFDDELFSDEEPIQHVDKSSFGKTVTVAEHPDALAEHNVVEK